MVRTSSPMEPESPAGADDGRTALDRLTALELFSALEPAELAQLALGTRHRRLAAGGSLWLAGEQATFFAVIEAGVVEIRQMTSTGEGVVVGLFRTGETIGLCAACLQLMQGSITTYVMMQFSRWRQPDRSFR